MGRLVLVSSSKEVGVLLKRGLGESILGPHVGGEVGVGLLDGVEGGLGEVSKGLGVTTRRGENVLNTSESDELLGDTGGDDTSTTGSGDETHGDGTALSGDLGGDSVGRSELVTPVSTADRDDVQLGSNDGTTDGSGDFLGALDSKTEVTSSVSDDHEGLEAGTLTGRGLLLNRHDLHNLLLELTGSSLIHGGQEVVDDLVLLNREGVQVDLLELADLAILNETSKLSAGNPHLTSGISLLGTSRSRSSVSTSTSTASSTSTSTSIG